MSRFLTAAALVLMLSASAQSQVTAGADTAARLPTITLPAELDRVLRDYEAAWRARDATALAALFTEDAFLLQPGRPPIRGRSALEARYRGQGGGPLRLRPLAYSVEGATGFIIGAYGYGDDPADGGKFTLTLKRGPGGRWLIFSDMDNGSR